jgi:cell division initiation protein
MITPVDIQNKEFSRKMSGYDRVAVDEFMIDIAEDYEKLYRENIDLKDKVANINESLRKYIAMEDAMQNTLIFAQNTADDVKKSATEKAEIMIKEAELKAKELVSNAQAEVLAQERKLAELKNEIQIYKTKFESLVASQKSLMDDMFN